MKKAIFIFLLTGLFACGSGRGPSVMENGNVLYYKPPVTEAEAKKALTWLHSINHNFGQPPADFGLQKENEKYIFYYPVQIKEAENDDGNISYMTIFVKRLSEDILQNKLVEVRLTDEDWKTIKRTISSK